MCHVIGLFATSAVVRAPGVTGWVLEDFVGHRAADG